MNQILGDVRFALRTLKRQPAFTATAVATMALAIGASTAIFSVVESTLLRPLPFQTPERLAFVWGVAGPQRAVRGASFIEAQDWSRLNRTFEHIAIYDQTSLNLRTDAGADRVPAEMVSASYFPMLGATPQVGRTFSEEEDRAPNTNPVVLISDRMWRGRFGGDSSIIGKSLTLNDRSFQVLGVMQPEFMGLSFDTDVWFPAAMVQANGGPADLTDRGTRWLGAVGRMKAGVTREQAQADVDRVAAQLAKDFPRNNTDRGVQLFTLRQSYLGSTQSLLVAVFAAVGLLLLIGCANVVSLQLVRASARSREIALRVAIGADRWRLVQQLVVEGLVLALLAAGGAWVVAYWGLQGLLQVAPEGTLPTYSAPTLNMMACAFTLLVTVICGVVFGLIPAARSSRLNLVDSLKDGARSSSGSFGASRFGPQQLIVVGETAVALILLVGAGLFVRSLQRDLAVSPGFDPSGILRVRVTLPQRLTPAMRLQFAEQLHDRLAAIPSVSAVAIASDLPLTGASSAAFISIPETKQHLRYYRHDVAPDFLAAMGIRMREGRTFEATDREGAPLVVSINESTARRLWPNESALGKRIRLGDDNGPEATIVGVVADVRYRDLRTALAASEPDAYFPLAQRPPGSLQIGVRSSLPAELVASAVRRELAAIDPTIPLFGVEPLEAFVALQTANGRFASTVLGVFGAAAVLLTAVGMYGMLAFLVSLRRREIGIRMALGATTHAVLRDVVGYGLRLSIGGITIGLIAAALVTKWVAAQLFGVSAHDPVVFTVVPLVFLAIATFASWLPGRRASRVEPLLALRLE